MTKEELEKIEEAARWQENYDKQLKDIKKLHKACHKWFMRWREAKKDALYFDSSLQKQIGATLKLQQENTELKEKVNILDNCDRLGDVITEAYKDQLTKAKELLAKWVELFKPKSETALPTPIQVETEQFLNSEEK